MRAIEAIVLALVATIAACYFVEIFVLPATRPDFLEMGRALDRARTSAQAGHGLRRHRHHRRDGDAAQPVSALRARAEPETAEGRDVRSRGDPFQFDRFDRRAERGVSRQRGDPRPGRARLLRQDAGDRGRRPGRDVRGEQRLDSHRVSDACAAARHGRRQHAVRRCASGQRTEQYHYRARWPGRS